MIEKNNVSALRQIQNKNRVEIVDNAGKTRVLFVGNSITRHEPKPEIGWVNDWGMAASKRENDYVHVVLKFLSNRFGKIDYCVVNSGEWETEYYNDALLYHWEKARDFNADIVVVRLGENIWNAKEYFAQFSLSTHFERMVKFFTPLNAKIVVTGLFWPNTEIDLAIKNTAKKLGATLVALDDLCIEENMAIGQFAHGGVCMHPNDNGMRKIAERIVCAINSMKIM